MHRTHHCNELRMVNVGQEVIIAGFVSKIRNYGSMAFVDIRDHYGITQIVVREKELLEKVVKIPSESTIKAYGKVVERENKNPNIATGDIEVEVEKVEILGRCKVNLPFEINDEYRNNKEDLRLQYRFLDLRNEGIHRNIVLRSKILSDVRKYMESKSFVEIQTPIFANSSPEGARDYLIPSRLHPGEFYALPQAPQQFKQLLMLSGFDKYYQIAPCFRDEDPRADRSPCEFYQVDFEMSFAEQDDVLEVLEGLLYHIFSENSEKILDLPGFRRIAYTDALEYYGIDKPDLRNPLVNINLASTFSDFEMEAIKGKKVYGIIVPKTFTRKEYDTLVEKVKQEFGGNPLFYFKNSAGELTGGISKFVDEELLKEMLEKHNSTIQLLKDKKYIIEDERVEPKANVENLSEKDEFSVFVVVDENKEKAQKIAGYVRIELGKLAEIIEDNTFRFCYIVDFPMYELTDEGKIDFAHNPFSLPQISKEDIGSVDPLTIKAYQYDAVCNGFEITSGAVRNYDVEMMEKVFEVAGYTKQDVKEKFKALYTAFEYGAMPHAGAAPGIDRIIMLIAEETNLREVMAFPKNKKARDMMINAPSKISEEQLKELHIKIVDTENE